MSRARLLLDPGSGGPFLIRPFRTGEPAQIVARLRLLHVDPFARCRGIGDALVRRCVGFARVRGYRQMILWTQTVLESARRTYARQGFECVETAVHERFGVPLQGETWRRELAA